VRLGILDRGHKLRHKALFQLIRVMTRHPAPDVVKLLKYRGEFFGGPINEVFQDALRGPSAWSVGDRELMAAYISKTNDCEF
jgi:hypothetical protein